MNESNHSPRRRRGGAYRPAANFSHMKRRYNTYPARPARIHVKPEAADGCRPTAIAAAIVAATLLVALGIAIAGLLTQI